MDEHRFMTMAHTLTSIPSRRHVLTGLAGLGLVLGASWLQEDVDAKKKKKRKNKKKGKKPTTLPPPPPTIPPPPPTPNAYGCLSVNVPCTGAAECCSNICEGGVCRGHGAGTCRQDLEGLCLADTIAQTACNNGGCNCLETTGGSKFCGDTTMGSDCAECQKDADCVAQGFPAGSACVPFSAGNCASHCPSGRACAAPCGTKPVES